MSENEKKKQKHTKKEKFTKEHDRFFEEGNAETVSHLILQPHKNLARQGARVRHLSRTKGHRQHCLHLVVPADNAALGDQLAACKRPEANAFVAARDELERRWLMKVSMW